MGKASSAKKVARAARAGGGRRARGRGEWMFPGIIAVIAVLGISLIVYANAGQESSDIDTPPRPQRDGQPADHFHMAVGFYECDTFATSVLTDKFGDRLGIHTHGDNIIHIHPFQPASAGNNAKLSRFAEETGLKLDDDELGIPDGKTYKEGRDKCGDKDGIVQAALWDSPTDEEPDIITEDFGDIALNKDRSVLTIAFAPEGTELPQPPSVPSLDNLSDVIDPTTSVPDVPPTGGGSTTPTGGGSTTSTTAAGGGSTTTAP